MLLYRLYSSGSGSSQCPAYMDFPVMVLDGVCCCEFVSYVFVMDCNCEFWYSCINCKMGILILLGMNIDKCIELYYKWNFM